MPSPKPAAPFLRPSREVGARWRGLLAGAALGALVGVLCGASSALFLVALDAATRTRDARPWLLFLLPVAGYGIGLVYARYGGPVAGGTPLLLERLHGRGRGSPAVPFRMAPLILAATVTTHLFGGSAGREGTAVQMGGALAGALSRPLRLTRRAGRLLIRAGISGGFGAVFGTPLAGAVFGLEVAAAGRVELRALIPCLTAALVGDAVCRGLGVAHAVYDVGLSLPPMTPARWAATLLAAALFAGAAALFIQATDAVGRLARARIARPEWRPVAGGVAVITLAYAVGSHEYLGLSLPLLSRAFTPGGVAAWAWALKLLFTAITLGSGFKGGEVTPLFVIGATLGAALASLTGQPVPFFAALGFVSVFAGAAKTPLACALLGIELFGGGMAAPLVVSCAVASVLSGRRGIYGTPSRTPKVGTPAPR